MTYLRGYKEIAQWLATSAGVTLSPKELCKYANWYQDPLPVVRPWIGAQRTGRVFAAREAVEQWARRKFTKVP
jgi:hypothetical protein